MKRVTILIPDDVSVSDISYWNGYRHVRVDVIDDGSCPKVRGLSNREVEEVCKRLREGMRKSSVAPYGLMVSRKEFEALRSRVEKLEQESKRQCARVIKMEEGISDDLK